MKNIIKIFLFIVLAHSSLFAVNDNNLTEKQLEYIQEIQKIWDTVSPQHGVITLPNGVATLNIPEGFYYLNPEDSQTVLETLWGNPPGPKPQGMIFPAGKTALDGDAWAVTIDYEEDGYVEDDDADDINYDDLLEEMREAVDAGNEDRANMGYEQLTLVGWASKPYYDKLTHKLHWAKEIKFGNQELNTLNYNIRVLGRKGVLVLNFIAGMDQLEMINSELENVLALASFDDGSTYADFNPDIDTVAAYGIGALIAGKLVAKTGLLVGALLLLKKFWFILVLGVGALFRGKKK